MLRLPLAQTRLPLPTPFPVSEHTFRLAVATPMCVSPGQQIGTVLVSYPPRPPTADQRKSTSHTPRQHHACRQASAARTRTERGGDGSKRLQKGSARGCGTPADPFHGRRRCAPLRARAGGRDSSVETRQPMGECGRGRAEGARRTSFSWSQRLCSILLLPSPPSPPARTNQTHPTAAHFRVSA